jgi:dienelactone hydrolase
MKSKMLLIVFVLLGNTFARAQSAREMVDEFLANPLQSPEVVTYQMQQFLMDHAPKLPHPMSPVQWTAEANRIRGHVLNNVIYHGWPKDWVASPPKFEDMGAVPVPAEVGYRLRKFRYEIVPGLYSTAVIYEPEHLEGKAPAVLDVLGHFPTGKSEPFEQKLCINQALRGMVALSVAFVDMGELRVKGNEHYYGSDLDLVGVNGVGLFYLAMRRGLDYLYNDPHVDQSRIAVTGLSGGGWQTLMLSSLDTRVQVSIPVAGFASLQGRLERLPGEPGDYEQLGPDLLDGQGYQTFVALRAPRPTLEINNAEDSCCFRAPLVKPDIFDAVKPFFALYGKEDSLQFHADTQVSAHNYQRDNRQQAYRFLSKWFHLPDKPDEIPVEKYVKSYSELASGVPADNLTILGLARQFASQIHRAAVPGASAGRAEWARAERARLSKVVHYKPVTVEHPWYMADTNHSTVESISFRFTLSNGLSATGVWTKSTWTPENAPMVVMINDKGRSGVGKEEWDHSPEAANLVVTGKQVLALSILFTGDAVPLKQDLGSLGYMMTATGAPPLGLEVAQLIAITQWAQQKWHPSQVTIESSGPRMQVVSLVAGAMDPQIFKAISIHQGMHSLSYILDKPLRSNEVPDLFCLDLYKDFDLDMLKALAEPAAVTESDYVELTPEKQ